MIQKSVDHPSVRIEEPMTPDPQATVRALHETACTKGAEALAALVATAFHQDAAVEWPARRFDQWA